MPSPPVRCLRGPSDLVANGTLNADGDLHFTPLPRIRTHRNADKIGYRWYNDHRLPDSDAARKSNRTENRPPTRSGLDRARDGPRALASAVRPQMRPLNPPR